MPNTIISNLKGPPGPVGPPGPAKVSSDSNNTATLGSDGLVYVQVDPLTNRKLVIGDTIAAPNAGNAIVLPSFATHGDSIWTPMSSFDDHFDAATLDPKWSYVQNITAGNQQELKGSCLFMGGWGVADTTLRFNVASQLLPNINPCTLSAKIDTMILPCFDIAVNTISQAYVQFGLFASASSGVAFRIVTAYQQNNLNTGSWLYVYFGPNFSEYDTFAMIYGVPRYYRIVYNSDYSINLYISLNNKTWFLFLTIGASQSPFNAASPPTSAALSIWCNNNARIGMACDWIRYTNP